MTPNEKAKEITHRFKYEIDLTQFKTVEELVESMIETAITEMFNK